MIKAPCTPPTPRQFFIDGLKHELSGQGQKAINCYRAAAFLGETEAMRNVSRCYRHGIGVQKHVREEIIWLKKAAEAGDLLSMFEYAVLFDKGERVNRNFLTAKMWYKAALVSLMNRPIFEQ